MKKSNKMIVVLALIFLVTGSAISAYALARGASLHDSFHHVETAVENRSVIWPQSRRNLSADTSEIAHSDDIHKLYLDLGYANCTIVTGDRFQIQSRNSKGLHWSVSDDTLHVTQSEERGWLDYIDKKRNNAIPTIVITVPKDLELSEAELTLDAGVVNINQLQAEEIFLSIDAGKLEVNELKADSCSLDCNAGEVIINGKIKENTDINCDVGSVTMKLDGNPKDYSYQVDVDAGTVKLNGKKYSGFNLSKSSDATDRSVSINCGFGMVDLTIAKGGK